MCKQFCKIFCELFLKIVGKGIVYVKFPWPLKYAMVRINCYRALT